MNVTRIPKVRDLTTGPRRLPIETDGSAVYDMILTIWSALDREEDHEGYELGPEWFADVRARMAPDLVDELLTLGGAHCNDWLGLIGLIATAPYPHDIDSVLTWLSRIEPIELRVGLLAYKCYLPSVEAEELAEKAAAGDVEALEELLGAEMADQKPELFAHYRRIFDLPEGELRDRMVAVLRRFRAEVYAPYEAEFGEATSRAAAARRALVAGADPERVIEEVTNGLDYRIQPGVARMVLVPSVLLRPWAVIDQHRETLVVAYPVADEFFEADPDAPPSWLVKMHKALGDERRLRILRRLSEGGAGLDDLSEMLGLAKSTVHHHVGLLRGAGLVRVHLDQSDGTKSYTLRPTVLPEALRSLDTYLRTDQSAHPTSIARSEA